MKIFRLSYLLLLLAIILAGCSPKPQKKEESSSPALQPKPAHREGSSMPASTGGLKFTPPAGWVAEAPTSESRKAQYRLPRADGDSEDAGLIVYYFNGGGGTPQANAERWIAEFSGTDKKPVASSGKISHKTINGISFTLVDVSGTYSSSMGSMMKGAAPKSGTRLLGAIAEAANGPWFIKLTGPEKTVAKWESGFQSFLNSVTPGE